MKTVTNVIIAIALLVIAVNQSIQTVRSMSKPPEVFVDETSIVEIVGKVSGDYTHHGAATQGFLAMDGDRYRLIPFDSTSRLDKREMPKLVRISKYGNYTSYSPLYPEE